MATDFPASPATGATFSSGGVTWTYDGTKWTIAPSGGSGGSTFGEAPNDGQFYVRQVPPGGSGLWVPEATPSQGFTNKFRNGTFDVAQRGASGSVAANSEAYAIDGWRVGNAGAAISWAQGAASGRTLYALSLTGAAGITDSWALQRIESFVAAPLQGRRVTVQARMAGVSITPTLTIATATAQDNFGSLNIVLSGVALQPISATPSVVAYSFDMPASAVNGVVVSFHFGALGASQNVALTECDLRATPGLPVGLCANPPPPELRPVHEETVFCQRYYWDAANGSATIAHQLMCYAAGAGNIQSPMIKYPVTMRIPPTLVLRNQSYNTNVSSAVVTTNSSSQALSYLTVTSAGSAWANFNLTASAEL